MENTGSNVCEVLEWDSRHFDLRIGRVRGSRLSIETIEEINRWRLAQQMDCLYLLTDIDRLDTTRLAETAGFQFTDMRVTLDRRLPREAGEESQERVRPFRMDDLHTLRRMAGDLHHDSRFHADTRFPQDRSRELFAVWIEKACAAPDYRVFVAEMGGCAVGYLACQRTADDLGEIQLIGVDSSARDRVFGTQLVHCALNWLTAEAVTRVSVVTQGRNIVAQRLYQKCGFATSSIGLWYHWWAPQHRG
jgi:dTDP-4-amino-4,6-dideoxy-D-galactose acyltransferase